MSVQDLYHCSEKRWSAGLKTSGNSTWRLSRSWMPASAASTPGRATLLVLALALALDCPVLELDCPWPDNPFFASHTRNSSHTHAQLRHTHQPSNGMRHACALLVTVPRTPTRTSVRSTSEHGPSPVNCQGGGRPSSPKSSNMQMCVDSSVTQVLLPNSLHAEYLWSQVHVARRILTFASLQCCTQQPSVRKLPFIPLRLPRVMMLMEKKMVKGDNESMGRGLLFRWATQKSALAETFSHCVGQQAPKSAPGTAGGPSGKQTTTRNLFLSKMRDGGGKAGADDGRAGVADATISTPDGGAQHAPQPAPGATAGEVADEGPTPSTTVQDTGPTNNTRSSARHATEHQRLRRHGAQHSMTLDTTIAAADALSCVGRALLHIMWAASQMLDTGGATPSCAVSKRRLSTAPLLSKNSLQCSPFSPCFAPRPWALMRRSSQRRFTCQQG